MGRTRHGYATITQAVCATIQRSKASLAALSRKHGINPKTVAKRRKRASVEDRKTDLKTPRSTVLSAEEEAVIFAFRRTTPPPLDDCLIERRLTKPNPPWTNDQVGAHEQDDQGHDGEALSLDVWSRGLMDWLSYEEVWLFRPGFADELVWRETA